MWKSGGQARRDVWQNPSWIRSQYSRMWEQPNYFLLFVFDRLFLMILFVSVSLTKYILSFTENEIMAFHLKLWLKIQVIKSIVFVGFSENQISLKKYFLFMKMLPSRHLLVPNQQAKKCCMGGVKLKLIKIIYTERMFLCYHFCHS